MTRYIAILDYDDGTGMYGAFFPDAPGCTAMGATEQEVIDNAIDALSEWVTDALLDGREVPEPRSYVQLLKSAEYSEMTERGMLTTIPLLRESGKLVRANISLDAGLLESIDQVADGMGLTRSGFLASAARDKIKASA